MRKPEPLNDRHFRALKFIRGYISEKGYAPGIREIGRAIGVRSTSLATYYLDGLETQGYLTRQKNIARSIVLTGKGMGA